MVQFKLRVYASLHPELYREIEAIPARGRSRWILTRLLNGGTLKADNTAAEIEISLDDFLLD